MPQTQDHDTPETPSRTTARHRLKEPAWVPLTLMMHHVTETNRAEIMARMLMALGREQLEQREDGIRREVTQDITRVVYTRYGADERPRWTATWDLASNEFTTHGNQRGQDVAILGGLILLASRLLQDATTLALDPKATLAPIELPSPIDDEESS